MQMNANIHEYALFYSCSTCCALKLWPISVAPSRYSQQNYIVLICFDSHVIMTVGGAIKLWQIIIIAYNRNAISVAYKHYECVCLFLYAWMVTQSKRYILCTVSVWVILCSIVLVQCSFPVLSHYLSHYCIYCLFILPVLFSSLSCS